MPVRVDARLLVWAASLPRASCPAGRRFFVCIAWVGNVGGAGWWGAAHSGSRSLEGMGIKTDKTCEQIWRKLYFRH